MSNDETPVCDITGRCVGQKSARMGGVGSGVCNCSHCGKELHWTLGAWWTWDASYKPNPQPQNEDPDA